MCGFIAWGRVRSASRVCCGGLGLARAVLRDVETGDTACEEFGRGSMEVLEEDGIE